MTWNPFQNVVNNFRNFGNNLTQRPIQTLAIGALGAVNPWLGMAGRFGANWWNDRQQERSFDHNSDAVLDRMSQQGDEAYDDAMSRHLKGPLGQFGNNNSALAGALMSTRPPVGGWNMSQVFGQQPGFSNPQNPGGLLGFLPGQSGQQTQSGPNLNALDQLLNQANGGQKPTSSPGGGYTGGFQGGMNWGGGTGGAILSNLGMASGVMNFGGWGGSPTAKGMLSDFKPG